jgi:hypothetical protein
MQIKSMQKAKNFVVSHTYVYYTLFSKTVQQLPQQSFDTIQHFSKN